MMQIAFPYPTRVRASVPKLEGLRQNVFTNIDGEPFAAPSLNGLWRVSIELDARGTQALMALSSFITSMSAADATCVLPICTQWRPNDDRGRMLARGGVMPLYTFDHIGFATSPFDGFTLRAAASHRDSYIDVNAPSLSNLFPGHFLTLGDRLHQVVNVTSIGEHPNRVRVSVMPNIRGDYPVGEVVIVDQLRLNARMESGDQIGFGIGKRRSSNLTFVEAF